MPILISVLLLSTLQGDVHSPDTVAVLAALGRELRHGAREVLLVRADTGCIWPRIVCSAVGPAWADQDSPLLDTLVVAMGPFGKRDNRKHTESCADAAANTHTVFVRAPVLTDSLATIVVTRACLASPDHQSVAEGETFEFRWRGGDWALVKRGIVW